MLNKIFSWFESRIDPYPEAAPKTPEKGLCRFVWSSMDGVRKWIAALAALTAGIGIMEALIFQFMGKIVEWLGKYAPAELFAEKGWELAAMAAMMVFSVVWAFAASNVRLQTLQGVFPMRLRWNFHRLMLNQSLGFYQDEFAGRVSAKVMQTALALRVNGLSQYIMWESARLFENIGIVNDGMATLSKPHTILDKPQALPLNVPQGAIKFEHVDFCYEAGKPLLNGFNLNIKPGEKVGLIGRSGAGKSTIVNLLLRFYEPQSGTVSIDGQDISGVTQESLRAQIGLVTQDTSLLHRSVRDNIIYGRPDATDAEMVSAAERAEAAGFIPDLSDAKGRRGYDAHVGERGVKLSGGQRQRIAIARVMLKDAPILLLDEATSALDSEVEAAIQESLDKMMEGKTVIAIAHRLSTIAAMDRLVVLDKGRIIEEGTHAELLEKRGLYAKLWAHQSGGFLSEHVEWQHD
ncbi:TPA: ABC transporter ATP-binding protein [Neisseria gonorrhoeae]